MTPQEITDLFVSAHARSVALIRKRMAAESEAIDAERKRVQALCAEHTGHVFAPDHDALRWGITGQICVYCRTTRPDGQSSATAATATPPQPAPTEARPIAITDMPDGAARLDIGEQVLELTGAEASALRATCVSTPRTRPDSE